MTTYSSHLANANEQEAKGRITYNDSTAYKCPIRKPAPPSRKSFDITTRIKLAFNLVGSSHFSKSTKAIHIRSWSKGCGCRWGSARSPTCAKGRANGSAKGGGNDREACTGRWDRRSTVPKTHGPDIYETSNQAQKGPETTHARPGR